VTDELRGRLISAIDLWVDEFGESPSVPVSRDVLIGATVRTLADLLLEIEEAQRPVVTLQAHVFLDMCIATGGNPPAFSSAPRH